MSTAAPNRHRPAVASNDDHTTTRPIGPSTSPAAPPPHSPPTNLHPSMRAASPHAFPHLHGTPHPPSMYPWYPAMFWYPSGACGMYEAKSGTGIRAHAQQVDAGAPPARRFAYPHFYAPQHAQTIDYGQQYYPSAMAAYHGQRSASSMREPLFDSSPHHIRAHHGIPIAHTSRNISSTAAASTFHVGQDNYAAVVGPGDHQSAIIFLTDIPAHLATTHQALTSALLNAWVLAAPHTALHNPMEMHGAPVNGILDGIIFREGMFADRRLYGHVGVRTRIDAYRLVAGLASIAPSMSAMICEPESSNSRQSSLYVANLPPDFSSDALNKIFAMYGPLNDCSYFRGRRYGFVHYIDANDARVAMNDTNGRIINRYTIQVEVAHVNRRTTSTAHEGRVASGAFSPTVGATMIREPKANVAAAQKLVANQVAAMQPSNLGRNPLAKPLNVNTSGIKPPPGFDTAVADAGALNTPSPVSADAVAKGVSPISPLSIRHRRSISMGEETGLGRTNTLSSTESDKAPTIATATLFLRGLDDVAVPDSTALADIFAQFGSVKSATLIRHPGSSLSRGFGFVHFEDRDSALYAYKVGNSLDGFKLAGKRVCMEWAASDEDTKRRHSIGDGLLTGGNGGKGSGSSRLRCVIEEGAPAGAIDIPRRGSLGSISSHLAAMSLSSSAYDAMNNVTPPRRMNTPSNTTDSTSSTLTGESSFSHHSQMMLSSACDESPTVNRGFGLAAAAKKLASRSTSPSNEPVRGHGRHKSVSFIESAAARRACKYDGKDEMDEE